MQKKDYLSPTIDVVELKQQQQLLAGSNGDGNLNPMGEPEDLSREFLFDEEVDL